MFAKFINEHLIARFKHHLMGRRFTQQFWERLNALSLSGMNIGDSSSLSNSGELWVIDRLAQHALDSAPTIFDVGANVGDYSLQVLSRCPAARLYCFEPSRKTFQLLSQNLADYKNAHLYNFGLGDKEESVTLYSDAETSGMASVYQRQLEHINVRMDWTEQVSLKTLDEFCRAQGVEHINLLKIDVEGHELNVLKGAQRLITSAAIDLIQFEFGGTDIDSRTFLKDFFNILRPNYRICRILKDGVSPLGAYQERFEIFVYSNFLAVSEEVYSSFNAGKKPAPVN